MPKTWFVGFALALLLVGLGVWLGEPGQVMMNAASVCLACLGVG